MSVVVVVPTFLRDEQELVIVERCIKTLASSLPKGAEIMIIDDGSPYEGTHDFLDRMCQRYEPERGTTAVFKEFNEGFSRTVNGGMQHALDNGHDALLVNADVEFLGKGWYEALHANKADIVGGLLLYPNGTVQHAGIFWSLITREFNHIHRLAPGTLALLKEPRVCPVTAALQLIRLPVMEKIGVYDTRFRMGYEDVSYCLDAFKAGFMCAYEPGCVAIHHESLFRGRSPSKLHRDWMKESWEALHYKHESDGFLEHCPTLIWD